ncbi:TonB-dependent siderophore receptor [Paraburkholderia dilworthii]|uniref:TonB-dependent receptor n=1 Tax=Paraburkholderia dilworthii TaxID=948106 RepID=A0ABW9DCG9_9BURK
MTASKTRKMLERCMLAALLGTLNFVSIAAHAQTTVDLPAQTLALSLSQLARDGNVNILAPAALTANHDAPALSGTLTLVQALDRLLQGTGLTAQKRNESTYVIERLPAQSGTAPPLAAEALAVLPTIAVTAPAATEDLGFAARSSSFATRTDTPIADIPQSIEVLTPDVLESQRDESVTDALRNISSMTIERAQTYTAQGTPYIRGFMAPVLINGLPVALTQSDIPLSLPAVALSRVEVLKGADSILAGSMDPGGIINVVTKTPQADPVHRLTVQTGSYGDWLGSLDLAGSILDDGKLTYRFVVSAEHADRNFIGYDGQRDFYVAPSIGWQDMQTRVVVGFEQHTSRVPVAPISLFLPGGPLQSSSPLGRPDDGFMSNSTSLYYDYTRKLAGSLTFHSKARYDAARQDFKAYALAQLSPGTSSVGIFNAQTDQIQQNQISLDNNLQMKIHTGSVKHTLLAGVAWSSDRYAQMPGNGPASAAALPSPQLPSIELQDIAKIPTETDVQATLYVQDQIAWGRLRVLLNLARSYVWTTHALPGSASNSAANWSPGIGIAYRMSDAVTVYANATHSFEPQYTFPAFDGRALLPRVGRSVEAGVKLALLDDRLTATAALFRSRQSNPVQVDPTHPGFYVTSPDFAYRGVEFDMTGRLLPGWNVIASYAYSNLQTPDDEWGQLPAHVASLWTTYDFQSEPLHGWGMGFGIWARNRYNATDSQEAMHPVPGQARTDASLYYRARHWSTTLSVKNVFNHRLYGDYALRDVELQPGRLFYLSSSYDF